MDQASTCSRAPSRHTLLSTPSPRVDHLHSARTFSCFFNSFILFDSGFLSFMLTVDIDAPRWLSLCWTSLCFVGSDFFFFFFSSWHKCEASAHAAGTDRPTPQRKKKACKSRAGVSVTIICLNLETECLLLLLEFYVWIRVYIRKTGKPVSYWHVL